MNNLTCRALSFQTFRNYLVPQWCPRNLQFLTTSLISKHSHVVGFDETSVPLCEETVASIVQAFKTKLIEENLYGININAILSSESVSQSSEAFFKALMPLYKTFCRKNDQDKLLQSFYGLIPKFQRF